MSGVLNINIAESVEELKSFSVRYCGAVCRICCLREKVAEFPPDHSHIWYFWISKKAKSLIQQGF
ncbi:MAG: hypothetical protein EWV65_05140 [Microcystis flos-aquae Ma_QC_C_20070823_S18D]|nr:MAG: hypothetical protein EWV65_05140 [Microcystis flos-aquae Ma_QC_C_20070823_S18D]